MILKRLADSKDVEEDIDPENGKKLKGSAVPNGCVGSRPIRP